MTTSNVKNQDRDSRLPINSRGSIIKHDGDTWRVLAVGAKRDGKVFAHLASTTRHQPGLIDRPIQIADYIDAVDLLVASTLHGGLTEAQELNLIAFLRDLLVNAAVHLEQPHLMVCNQSGTHQMPRWSNSPIHVAGVASSMEKPMILVGTRKEAFCYWESAQTFVLNPRHPSGRLIDSVICGVGSAAPLAKFRIDQTKTTR